MIPQSFIQDWKYRYAPWPSLTMVEQDLIISRALVELYQQPTIKKALVFRGGTALNKIYINPPSRYSEDIDLVQIKAGPIREIVDTIRIVLDPWLGEPKRKLTDRCVKLLYRFQSSENLPARLKIEINTTEHYHVLELAKVDFSVESAWFTGTTQILTYQLNELMGSKMCALYNRRKGRDLFDLWLVLKNNLVDTQTVLEVFLMHCEKVGQKITRTLFERNLFEKNKYDDFRLDILGLLANTEQWSFTEAYQMVNDRLICLLPGEKWKKPACEIEKTVENKL
ncbi:MAG: uncharacterized protein K0R24_1320 [Gammaproteobacteria bacterium]|jgi:predicted nucleotidyltransferase component of viral defense system|nr:uncharacterized protein [Gammaproteobacteria bacterium]